MSRIGSRLVPRTLDTFKQELLRKPLEIDLTVQGLFCFEPMIFKPAIEAV